VCQQYALVQSVSSAIVLITIQGWSSHCADIFLLKKYGLQLQQFGNSSASITTTCWCYDCYRRGSNLTVACFGHFSCLLWLLVK
jgi:hypothetical protein